LEVAAIGFSPKDVFASAELFCSFEGLEI